MTVKTRWLTALLALLIGTPAMPQEASPFFIAMGDSIGEGVQTADASIWSQPWAFPNLMAVQMGRPFPLPLIWTWNFGQVGSTLLRFRIDPNVRALNLAVSGADVNSLLYDRADGITDTETDLVLMPRRGSQMEIAESLRPTYVACWIGSNDALATVTAYDHMDASQLTPLADFDRDFRAIATRLKATGAKVVFATVPHVTDIAFVLTGDEVRALLGTDYGLAVGSRTSIVTVLLVGLGLASPTVMQDPNYVLTPDEAAAIATRVDQFNAIIKQVAAANGFGVADMQGRFRQLSLTPLNFYGVPITTRFLGGLFSLDGVHPSNLAHALISNEFNAAFNSTYGTAFPPFNSAALDWFFVGDPFIDKDRDGKVAGRPGAGLLELFMWALGISGDSNDALPAATTTGTSQATAARNPRITPQAASAVIEEYRRQTGKDLRRMSQPERLEEFRQLFGLQRFRPAGATAVACPRC